MKFVNDSINEVLAGILEEHADFTDSRIDDAAAVLRQSALGSHLSPFLTTSAYAILEN
jgi:hypothetical protein